MLIIFFQKILSSESTSLPISEINQLLARPLITKPSHIFLYLNLFVGICCQIYAHSQAITVSKYSHRESATTICVNITTFHAVYSR